MTTSTGEIDLINSSGKAIVADLLKRLSEEVTLAEIGEEVLLLAGLREGLIDSRKGNVTPHDEFMLEVRSWYGK
jgi:predicted transcriptional regulator